MCTPIYAHSVQLDEDEDVQVTKEAVVRLVLGVVGLGVALAAIAVIALTALSVLT